MVTAVDVALSANPLTITGTVLFVPLALAVVGDWREVAITGVVALAIGLASSTWNTSTAFSQDVYRVGFYTVFAGLAVIAARTRQRATAMAAANQALAVELRGTRAQLDGILGALAEAVTVHDERGATVYANPAAAELLGYESVDEVLATAPGEVAERFAMTDEEGRRVSVEELPGRRLMAGEQVTPLLTQSIRYDGEAFWLLTKATLYRDPSGARLAINVIEDVTETKDAELRERFLAEAGQLLASSLDYGQTLERVARMVVPRLADWCGDRHARRRGRDPAGRGRPRRPREGRAGARDAPALPAGHGRAQRRARDPPRRSRRALLRDPGRAARRRRPGRGAPARDPRGRPQVGHGSPDADRRRHARRHLARDRGERTALRRGRPLFAQDLALRAATAVQNSRLFEEQQRVARTLQASLLPERLPALPGWEIHAAYQAGERGSAVGGDFYDVLAVDAGHLIVLGDVTGKGVEAAALTSLVRHSARMAARFDPRPARVLSLINDVLREQTRLSLVTAVCALLEDVGGSPRLTVASAGHPLPLRRTRRRRLRGRRRARGAAGRRGDRGLDRGRRAGRARRHAALLHRRRHRDAGRAERFGESRLVEAVARAAPGLLRGGRRDRARAGRVPGRHGGRRPRDARDAVRGRPRDRRGMRRRYDVVVVGGGHNGLVAAAYLTRAGRSVLVLERRGEVGGAAVSEAPFAGVDARLSRYAYLVSLLPRQIVRELGLAFETRRRRISSYTPVPGTYDGLLIDAADAERTRASMRSVTGSDEAFAAWQDF